MQAADLEIMPYIDRGHISIEETCIEISHLYQYASFVEIDPVSKFEYRKSQTQEFIGGAKLRNQGNFSDHIMSMIHYILP
jgi:hypothetical protein